MHILQSLRKNCRIRWVKVMEIDKLEEELNNQEKQIGGIYLLYGEETFLLEAMYKKIRSKFGEIINGINYVVIDNQGLDTLVGELQTPAFGYERKLIVLKNSEIVKKDGKKKNIEITERRQELLEYIENNKEEIAENIVLIIIEETCDERTKIFKYMKENYTVCEFAYQTPAKIEKRLNQIVAAYKVNIDQRTLKYLIESCGVSMQDLINETRKLIEYKGEGGTIQREDIDKLSIKKFESIIFELTDQLGKKQIKNALKTLDNLIYAKEPIQKILITLYNHFKKIYITKLCVKDNLNLLDNLKLKPNQTFLTTKYKDQARCFDEMDLRCILGELIWLDHSYKNGKIEIRIGLETILCKYC